MSTIDGLKIRVEGEELKEHLMRRVSYHSELADKYARASTGVKDAQSEDGEAENLSNNPRQSLGQSEKRHRNQATYFKFIADHLFEGVTYILDQADLITIEVMDRGW